MYSMYGLGPGASETGYFSYSRVQLFGGICYYYWLATRGSAHLKTVRGERRWPSIVHSLNTYSCKNHALEDTSFIDLHSCRPCKIPCRADQVNYLSSMRLISFTHITDNMIPPGVIQLLLGWLGKYPNLCISWKMHLRYKNLGTTHCGAM